MYPQCSEHLCALRSSPSRGRLEQCVPRIHPASVPGCHPCHPHLWQCRARSLGGLGCRCCGEAAGFLRLGSEGTERKRRVRAQPRRDAAARSCDRAALSQGAFPTPSWVGSPPSRLKPSRWARSSAAPGRTRSLTGTGVTCAQDSHRCSCLSPWKVGGGLFSFLAYSISLRFLNQQSNYNAIRQKIRHELGRE